MVEQLNKSDSEADISTYLSLCLLYIDVLQGHNLSHFFILVCKQEVNALVPTSVSWAATKVAWIATKIDCIKKEFIVM